MQRRQFQMAASVAAGLPFERPAWGADLHQSGAAWFSDVAVTTQDGRPAVL
jgi:hypothetical protein